MAVFEIEKDGQTYEVEAPDQQTALRALGQNAPAAPAGGQQQGPAFDPTFGGDPLGAMFKANAGQNQAQSAAMATGVAEGGRRLMDGLKQAYGNATDFFGALVHGKPYIGADTRNADGSITRGAQLDTSAGLKATADGVLRQQLQTETDRARGVNIPLRNVNAAVTETAPLALAPEAALPRATTILGGLVKNSVAGGIGGALQFNADNSNSKDALIGAGAAPVLGLIPSLAPAAKNMIGRALRKVAAEGRVAPRVANARTVLPNVDYSLAQTTGIPELTSLERAAYDSKMVNFFADQTDNLIGDAANALRQPVPAGFDITPAFTAARADAGQALRQLKQNATNSWEAGIAQVRDEAAQAGHPVVPMPTLGQTFKMEKDTATNLLRNMQKQAIPGRSLKALEKALDVGPQGQYVNEWSQTPVQGMTVDDLSDVMIGLTGLSKSDDAGVRRFAGSMRDAIGKDLDALAQQPDVPRGAVRTLLDTRAEYKRSMQAADVLGESAAYKLMGVTDEAAPAPDALLQRYQGLSEGRQASARQFMEANAPDLLAQLKQTAIDDAVKKAGTIRAAGDSQQSLDQFTEALFDPKNGFTSRTQGLWNGEELRRLEGIKDGLRVIQTNRPVAGQGSGTRILPEDIAINLVSRHSAFVARQLTRVLMSAKASSFFTDPNIYTQLTKIGRTTTGTPTNVLARAALLETLQTDYAEPQNGQ